MRCLLVASYSKCFTPMIPPTTSYEIVMSKDIGENRKTKSKQFACVQSLLLSGYYTCMEQNLLTAYTNTA